MKNLAKHKTLLKTREYIVQAIFQLLFNSQNSETIIEQFLHEHKNKKFEEDFFSSTLKNIENKIRDFETIESNIEYLKELLSLAISENNEEYFDQLLEESKKILIISNKSRLENLMSDFKLLPVPEINTAVFILFVPVDRTI